MISLGIAYRFGRDTAAESSDHTRDTSGPPTGSGS